MVKELREEKHILENQIESLIQTFEEKTETQVVDIEVIRNEYPLLGGLVIKKAQINIKVEI